MLCLAAFTDLHLSHASLHRLELLRESQPSSIAVRGAPCPHRRGVRLQHRPRAPRDPRTAWRQLPRRRERHVGRGRVSAGALRTEVDAGGTDVQSRRCSSALVQRGRECAEIAKCQARGRATAAVGPLPATRPCRAARLSFAHLAAPVAGRHSLSPAPGKGLRAESCGEKKRYTMSRRSRGGAAVSWVEGPCKISDSHRAA